MRSSGANGWPLRIPTAASCPRISGSPAPTGSCWTSSSIVSQYEKSLGMIVHRQVHGVRPESWPPGCRPFRACTDRSGTLFDASTAGAGSLSTMNARPIKHARVVRTWDT
jgi:hypothetical protein